MEEPSQRSKCQRPNCPNVAHRRHQGYCQKHYGFFPHGYVDATKCIDRITALRNAGYSMYAIAEMSGLDRDTLTRLGTWTDFGRVKLATYQGIMSIPVPVGVVDGGNPRMPNVGTKRRVQALMAAGYPLSYLANELGLTVQCVQFWLRKGTVSSFTACRVRDLFKRLEMTPGPSARARNAAARKGWAPPLAWDEDSIDDPAAESQLPQGSRDAWFDDFQELKALGVGVDEIAQRMGVLRETLRQRLRRLKLPAEEYERCLND